MKRSRPSGRSFIRQQLILFLIPALWLGAVDALASSDGGAESSLFMVLIFIAGLVAVSVLIITALTRWGHKQDSIGNMMTFCIKYLVETRNEAQKCEAAQALGQVKDPGALLILVDVINDESAEENLRKTTPDQVPDEIGRLLDLVDEMLTTFGYPYTIELATRPEKALGPEKEWVEAQNVLAEVLTERGKTFEIDEGGGAFYGPKLDFKLIDAIGRKWQGPTVQLDFNLPDRFEMEYVGEDNEPHRPVMLHRVLVGSMERFVGGLIEHYAGDFPLWLAPEQVRVLPISEQWTESAQELVDELKAGGIRAALYDRETLGYRIRDAERQKVPYMGVVGEREAEAGTVAVRKQGAGKKQEIMSRAEFLEVLREEVQTRALRADLSQGEGS